MNPKTKFFFLWLAPIIVALGFELLYADFRIERWKNVVENLLFAIGMLMTLVFFNSKKINVFLANFYFLIFVVCLFFESSFFHLFNAIFSASAIFIILETNVAEAQEFLGFYIDLPILIYLFILAIATFFYLKMPKQALFKKKAKKTKWIVAFIFIGLLSFMKFSGIIVPNLPYLVGKATYGYITEKNKMAATNMDNPIGNFKNVSQNPSAEKSLYVLILGESTTRNHLGIYGYYRNTTPKLKEIEGELLAYQNVISPHVFTIGALKETLTLNGFKSESESSIVQLMNQAGFKTYWFSNQRPIGPFESLVTDISQASDVVRFTNTALDHLTTPYDSVLLDYFDKALTDEAPKKFIVLHILGTHLKYRKRYPEKFAVFRDKPTGNFNHDLAVQRINNYDNAVRYMDTFIRTVIEKTRKENIPSYVLFFSDHGEEVFSVRDFSGHLEANPTRNMFEIPFILWRSEKFKNNSNIAIENLEKPYVTDNFLFSLADLSEIDFEGMEKEKSIFSEKFEPQKRIVGEGIDFDTYFKDKKTENYLKAVQ